jgi:hypothetical protein
MYGFKAERQMTVTWCFIGGPLDGQSTVMRDWETRHCVYNPIPLLEGPEVCTAVDGVVTLITCYVPKRTRRLIPYGTGDYLDDQYTRGVAWAFPDTMPDWRVVTELDLRGIALAGLTPDFLLMRKLTALGDMPPVAKMVALRIKGATE